MTPGEPEPIPTLEPIPTDQGASTLEPIPTLEQIRTGDDTPATPEGVR